MKLLRVGAKGAETPVASFDGIRGVDLTSVVAGRPAGYLDDEGAALAGAALEDPAAPHLELSGRRIGSPVHPVGKVVCVGLNYRRHAVETNAPIPAEPILFLKAADTVQGPNDDVVIPKGSSKTDYEVELAVVIGRTCRYLGAPEESRAYIRGYTITNDVSERAFQTERGGTWDKGKNSETFGPLGPFIATAEEVPDPNALRVSTAVNGEVRQDSSTADMIFGVDHLIWYISQFMTLHPGDVVSTGTPEGVGMGLDPPRFLRDGDTVELRIDGLGIQRQRFRAYQEEARS